jgi:hypothetical protein
MGRFWSLKRGNETFTARPFIFFKVVRSPPVFPPFSHLFKSVKVFIDIFFHCFLHFLSIYMFTDPNSSLALCLGPCDGFGVRTSSRMLKRGGASQVLEVIRYCTRYISLGYLWDICGISVGYLEWGICGIYVGYTWDVGYCTSRTWGAPAESGHREKGNPPSKPADKRSHLLPSSTSVVWHSFWAKNFRHADRKVFALAAAAFWTRFPYLKKE